MTGYKALIILGLCLSLAGILLWSTIILLRFAPYYDGDSVALDILEAISKLALSDYIWLFLSIVFFLVGVFALVRAGLNMSAGKTRNKLPLKERFKEAFWMTVCVILLPAIIVYLLLYGIRHLICSLWLSLMVRLQWFPQGKNVLFVYSDSPNWKEYIESNILTRISDKAVVVNWSERSKWDWTNKPLVLRIFRHWTGVFRYTHASGKKRWDGREFNPIAITFVPWWRPRVFRLWKAFTDYKHGKDKKLHELENQLFRTLKLEK